MIFSLVNFSGYQLQWSTLPDENGNRRSADPHCGYNHLQSPPASTPLFQHFEDFAQDNQKWIKAFVPAFEKMLANGYSQ